MYVMSRRSDTSFDVSKKLFVKISTINHFSVVKVVSTGRVHPTLSTKIRVTFVSSQNKRYQGKKYFHLLTKDYSEGIKQNKFTISNSSE